jgi:uncharacterized protein (TIGR02466 family)
MEKLEKIDLFSTPVWKCKIDPMSYNKQELIDSITHNYDLQPSRNINVPDFEASSHNYYKDWNNPKYKKLNLSLLEKIYNELMLKLLDQHNFVKDIRYRYEIVNIQASKKNQNIGLHDHPNSFYSSVHYLKLDDDHKRTRFFNPLIIGQYISTLYDTKKLMNIDIQNSNYFNNWIIPVEEDDMVFFPSYLKHSVDNETSDELRISVSCNLSLLE